MEIVVAQEDARRWGHRRRWCAAAGLRCFGEAQSVGAFPAPALAAIFPVSGSDAVGADLPLPLEVRRSVT